MPRPIYTDPEIAGVGLTEAEAREQYGDDVAVGQFPWVANARAVMQNETVGWVKSIHETRYGELLGLVMVGPHVTDLIEAGVVAIDAEATVETVADGMAPHPTLSEAIKEAGLVALGRAIHVPNRKPRARRSLATASQPSAQVFPERHLYVRTCPRPYPPGPCRPQAPGEIAEPPAAGRSRWGVRPVARKGDHMGVVNRRNASSAGCRQGGKQAVKQKARASTRPRSGGAAAGVSLAIAGALSPAPQARRAGVE